MTTIKVAIVGAAGETGMSIVKALLPSTTPKFEITSLTRPASVNKPINVELKNKGVQIVPVSLTGPQDEVVKALAGIDVVISTINPAALNEQIHLADAAKLAGVKRFIPSNWAPVTPPEGVMLAREQKERIINHVLKIRLGYTIIDVGLWYQVAVPPVPSGRLDYCAAKALKPLWALGGDGNVASALTYLDDIGRYVAHIIADPRTLNKKVFAYNETLTRNQIYDLLERLSGESLERNYVSEEEANKNIEQAKKAWQKNPEEINAYFALAMAQYFMSVCIRGDNTPECAQYLGYLDCKDLYPDFEFYPFEQYLRDALDGKAKPVLMDY
ncbi:uncharacterized protein Z518_02123 [Rhinocladiella mackenziei CBS 650.93]|uniref:NmrA-like domain-containing protein n=1 Tax=Rhinocladiella mackenziei CBS 650.93 TaxID=1442369 RepID=A0A0D2JE75_9EURO|nr:uncharacterized protein Z518_02123 [Rhinocladiella mackenziei CBS 650.93]KIX07470.1 hypothetical protein Z518_02123 [Rhinocladiella mackenziei CBS 650.93]